MSQLENSGVQFGGSYIGEGFADLAGGIDRGTIYEGRLEVDLDLALDKLLGWQGASAHASAFQIHGHGPSANLVGNLLDVSNIEALPATRLFTLWLQQNLLQDRISLRLGQIAADDEFVIAPHATGFLNSTFGWPELTAADTTSGGPVYPLATPGVRLELKPAENLAVRAAVFSGNPAGSNCTENPQICNPSGTTFSFSGGTLWLGEVQYQAEFGNGLPGIYKLGGWFETGSFPDQHFGVDGEGMPVSLASPQSVGPFTWGTDFGFYAIADQTLWSPPGAKDRGLAGFVRIGGAPQGDRNLISLYADGGLSYKGPLPARPADVAMIGVAYGQIGAGAVALSRDLQAVQPGAPVRDYEAVVEASYRLEIRPSWTLQPDFQYVIHPGGNAPNPKSPPAAIQNAVVIALRTTITF